MSQHLYEISKDYAELQRLADESDDEGMQIAIRDTLEAVEGSFNDKAKNLVNVMRNVTSSVESIDAEISRLQAKKKTIQNKELWFKDYLRENMEKAGISKIECDLFRITLAKPKMSVDVTDVDALPDDLKRTETKVIPDKAAIKKRLQCGSGVPGASLKESTRRLLIK